MAKKKKLFRTTGGAGYVPPSPDVEALVRNILASDPERTKDILYRIISLGNSAEGTKYDRNAYDILMGVYDSFTDKPMDEDRYTGSWTWTEDGIKSNPERDWNLLFAKGNIKGLYEEIPKNELRGINLSNKYPSYYGNFVPKSHYDITDNYGPLLQYLANHNLGGQVLEEDGLGVVALPLSELEYQQAVRDKYTVDNVGRFNVSIGKDPNGNPEVLFFDFGNFGREYGDTYGGANAGLLGELLDTYGNPFILRLYVPINTLSKDQFNTLPEDDKWNVEDMNTALLNIANANKVPVMLHDLDTDTYETVFLPEVEKVANKRAEGGALHPEWNSLSMRERAAYIRDAVSRGLNTVTDIRNDYNKFKDGGKKSTRQDAAKQTFLDLLEKALEGNSRYNTAGWRQFLTDLAKTESSYRGDITNNIGAKGYFLLMPSNRSASWSTPIQQFLEMFKLSDANMEYFRKNLTEKDLKLAQQKGIDLYGLMAGAHLGGAANAIAALRGTRNTKDNNGTSVLSYMTRFSQTNPRLSTLQDFFNDEYVELPDLNPRVVRTVNPYLFQDEDDLPSINYLLLLGDLDNKENSTIDTEVPVQELSYILYTPDLILSLMNSMIVPYKPVLLPKLTTATEILKLEEENRTSLLLKGLEDNIRSYILKDLTLNDAFAKGGSLSKKINNTNEANLFYTGGKEESSELDWSPLSWFGLRVPKPDGTLYNLLEARILASHVPEYRDIERTAKANGTWLTMPDGSTWEGDPRSWVMMLSKAYKKNYSPQPWYTGQAEWPTTFDYPNDGKKAVKTNKMTRAPYYNGLMWFSNDKSYGDAFAYYYGSDGDSRRKNRPEELNVWGHNFLAAIPKRGVYRTLAAPAEGSADEWRDLPYVLKGNRIYRLPQSQQYTYGPRLDYNVKVNSRKEGESAKTDDVANWSRDLGDNGLFLHKVVDGSGIKVTSPDVMRRYNNNKPVKNSELEITYPVLEEFISQPGFTDKVKFIEGNTGDFDINNPYKYTYNFKEEPDILGSNYAAYGGNLFSGEDTPTQQMSTYNGWVRDANSHPIAFNDEGKYYDQITGETGELQLPNVNIYPNNYRSNFDSSLGLSGFINDIENLYQYSKGYINNKLNGTGDGEVIDLSNQNVARINSNTRDVTSILTNDFVEHNNNAIRKKKDFVNTTDTLLGDKKIPLSKISTFYGIEDGKLKVGPLEIFDDETVVVPNRAKNVGKVKEYYPGKPASQEYKDAVQEGIVEYNTSKGYEPDWLGKLLPFAAGASPGGILYHNLIKEEGNTREGRERARKRRNEIMSNIYKKYSYLGDGALPYVVTEDNDTIKGYNLNASPKTLFADENGNAIFVANPRQHVEEINSYLQNTPMYPVMVDNGRYAAYQTSFPNAEVYGGLNRPNNMFILGTTKAYGGNLFDGTTQPTQQMNSGLNLYRRTNNLGETEYVYQETPDSEEILLTPTNKRFSDDPTNWDYKDASGREYSPRMVNPTNSSTLEASGKMGPLEKYVAELNWRAKNDPASIALQGKYTMPAIAAAPFLAWAGEAAYPYVSAALANPYVDAGLTSAFAGHGLNHAINEGIDGWGDAAITALEIAPLGRLAKPLYESTSNIINSAYNKLPWTYKIPENPNMAYRRMGPLERDWLMEGNELSTRSTNPLTEVERDAAVAAEKAANPNRRFVLFKAGAEHGGRKLFAKGQPWKGTTVTNGEEQVLAIPGEGLPWVSGRHFHGPQGDSFGVGDISFEEAPFGSHIDLLTEEGYTGVNPSLLDGSVIYSPYKILGRNFGYKKLYPKITTPQMTPENAAADIDYTYKVGGGNNETERLVYWNRIHGKPSYPSDTNGEGYAAGVVRGLPWEAQEGLLNNTVARNMREFAAEGVPESELQAYADKAKEVMDGVYIGRYPNSDYVKAGWEGFSGFYDDAGNFISINTGTRMPEVNITGHEGRHLLDHQLDDNILMPKSESFGLDFDKDKALAGMLRAVLKLRMMLTDAYDGDFLRIPKTEYGKGLENYNMERDAITTNKDARDVILLDHGAENWSPEKQNELIDKMSDDEVFNAVFFSNGYGERFIRLLKSENKLTPKKAQQFREAMKHVGVAAFPVAAGAGLLFGLNNL